MQRRVYGLSVRYENYSRYTVYIVGTEWDRVGEWLLIMAFLPYV